MLSGFLTRIRQSGGLMEPMRFWSSAGATVTLCLVSMIADADIISTDQSLDQAAADHDRARVQEFLDRKDASEKLRSMGLDKEVVRQRVEKLTGQEVHELARQFDALPAGGNISDRNLIAILLIVLLVVLLI
jgi:hypothetical protein